MIITDALKAKLQKLNALAERAATPEEAAIARGQLVKLMAKYGIVSDDIQYEETDEPEPVTEHEVPLYVTKQIFRWKSRLSAALCRLHGVFGYYTFENGYRMLKLVGTERGVQSVRYQFPALVADVDRLAAQYKGEGRTFLNNYRHGVVDVIVTKLAEAFDEAKQELREEGNTRALVRLEGAVATRKQAEQFARARYNLSSQGASQARGDSWARRQGRLDAQNLSVGGSRAVINAGTRRLSAGC